MMDQDPTTPAQSAPATSGHVPPTGPQDILVGPKGHPIIAWICIVLFCMVAVVRVVDKKLEDESAPSSQDRLGVMLMEVQAKYLVGAASEIQDAAPSALLYESAKQLNDGTIGQRQRAIVLAAEIAGGDTASQALEELERLIDREQLRTSQPVELTPEQVSVQEILHELYDAPAAQLSLESSAAEDEEPRIPNVELLSHEDRQLLIDELGWFGHLALAPPGTPDDAAREAVLRPSRMVVRTMVAAFGLGCAAGIGGLIGLVVVVVLVATGRSRLRFVPGRAHHGIYAETFAIWMLVFFPLQIAASFAGEAAPAWAMVFALVAFFASLSALIWPVLRGVPWAIVQQDIGLILSRNSADDPAIGLGGYFMALPILAVGVGITLVFVLLQRAFAAPGSPFSPTGGPAHPIFEHLAGPNWLQKAQILILAAIAAPIVEETMFRGVLYRHLRSASQNLGLTLSILLSATVSAFIFAVIHPQGWVAIPALMSLAIAFSLMREWRGSVVPCMVMHGTSNLIVMSLAILFLGA